MKKNTSCTNLLNKDKSNNEKINKNKIFNRYNNNILNKKKLKVEKFHINKKSFEYSNSFRNKKIYIDGLRDRETNFLKKLLQMKKYEKFEINDLDLMKTKREATKKFNYIKENVKLNPDDIKEILNKLLEDKILFNKEKANKNKNVKNINEGKEINKIKKNENNYSFYNKELSNEHNKKIIDYIDYEISDIIKVKKEKLNKIKEIQKFGICDKNYQKK
jgi:hypothetical protein